MWDSGTVVLCCCGVVRHQFTVRFLDVNRRRIEPYKSLIRDIAYYLRYLLFHNTVVS